MDKLNMTGDDWYELHDTWFTWNHQKARDNKQKHGISFREAASALFDPWILCTNADPENEQLCGMIGFSEQENLLFVVHLFVDDDAVRIVSARRATVAERRRYES